MDVHLSFPVLFVVLQKLYFRHHGIYAHAFLRMDWVVDEHCEDVSLPERLWQDLDNQTFRTVQTAERNLERETEACGLGEVGASPFGSRMPKETRTSKEPTDYTCVLIFVFFFLGLFDLLTCLRVCILGVSYLT